MADETPETPETAESASAGPAGSASADPVGSSASAERPAVPQTPKERKVAARNRRGKRRGATPEERAAERAKKAVARRRRREQEREKAKAARAAAGPVENVPPRAEHGPGRPKVRLGIVSSDKGDKTITVVVDEARKHRKYQKIVRSTQKLHAHDERNDAGTGDRVRIVECRPMSASKRWRLDEVLERAR